MQGRDHASQSSVRYYNSKKKSLEELLNKNTLFHLEPKYPLKGQESDKIGFFCFEAMVALNVQLSKDWVNGVSSQGKPCFHANLLFISG